MGDPKITALPVRVLYSVNELARAVGVDRRRLHRLLVACGVELLPLGSRVFVPLSEIATKLKPLWESIRAAESVRQVSGFEGD